MKKLIKFGAIASLAMAMAMAMPALALAQEEAKSDWSLQGNLTGTSDYIFRGVSLTDEYPAAQGSLTVSHASGFYGYVWGSNVDFSTPGDGINAEVDYGVGWGGNVAEGVKLDLLAVRFTYPGANDGFNIDYNEYSAKVTVAEHYFAMIAYDNDYIKSSQSAVYYQVGANWPIADTGFTVAATAGYYDLKDAVGDSYYDYRLGVNRNFGPVNVDLSFIDTSSFGAALGNSKLADARALFTVSWTFDLFK